MRSVPITIVGVLGVSQSVRSTALAAEGKCSPPDPKASWQHRLAGVVESGKVHLGRQRSSGLVRVSEGHVVHALQERFGDSVRSGNGTVNSVQQTGMRSLRPGESGLTDRGQRQ